MNFAEAMAQRSDAELLKIITFERDQFQPEAILAAEEECRKRKLSLKGVEITKTREGIQIKTATGARTFSSVEKITPRHPLVEWLGLRRPKMIMILMLMAICIIIIFYLEIADFFNL